jgi:hypothetical protein
MFLISYNKQGEKIDSLMFTTGPVYDNSAELEIHGKGGTPLNENNATT